MTEDEIRKMPAGPELDRLVGKALAEKEPIPWPRCSKISDSFMQALDRMEREGWFHSHRYHMGDSGGVIYEFTFDKYGIGRRSMLDWINVVVQGSTLMEAGCRAMVIAKMREKSHAEE